MADDILIASLALLATSWAGVTFATNGGANTAISNLLQSKPAVKLSLAYYKETCSGRNEAASYKRCPGCV